MQISIPSDLILSGLNTAVHDTARSINEHNYPLGRSLLVPRSSIDGNMVTYKLYDEKEASLTIELFEKSKLHDRGKIYSRILLNDIGLTTNSRVVNDLNLKKRPRTIVEVEESLNQIKLQHGQDPQVLSAALTGLDLESTLLNPMAAHPTPSVVPAPPPSPVPVPTANKTVSAVVPIPDTAVCGTPVSGGVSVRVMWPTGKATEFDDVFVPVVKRVQVDQLMNALTTKLRGRTKPYLCIKELATASYGHFLPSEDIYPESPRKSILLGKDFITANCYSGPVIQNVIAILEEKVRCFQSLPP